MARTSSSSVSRLRTRLSSRTDYLEAVAELRANLLHSSPSYLISNPEELISLVEVAKSTLQSNGISLHTFSSCPDYLSTYKAAYFGLLLQLQVHSHNARLESKDLQVRLNRLLFPLSTQLKVCTKAARQAVPGGYARQNYGIKGAGNDFAGDSPRMRPAPLRSGSTSGGSPSATHATPSCARRNGPPTLPPNVMLPPPAPVQRSSPLSKPFNIPTIVSSRSLLSRYNGEFSGPLKRGRSVAPHRRKASYDTVHFKRRHAEPIVPSSSTNNASIPSSKVYNMSEGSVSRTDLRLRDCTEDEIPTDEAESSDSSSDEDSDADSESSHVLVPSHSPLRRSFGIFCTGKGRGAFSGPVRGQRHRSASSRMSTQSKSQREPNEDAMDTGL